MRTVLSIEFIGNEENLKILEKILRTKEFENDVQISSIKSSIEFLE